MLDLIVNLFPFPHFFPGTSFGWQGDLFHLLPACFCAMRRLFVAVPPRNEGRYLKEVESSCVFSLVFKDDGKDRIQEETVEE